MAIKPINTCPVPNGILIAIGGHENKGEKPEKKIQKENFKRLEVLKTFINLTGKENPVVELITTAGTAEIEETFKEYQDAFAEIGVHQLGHIHHETREEALNNTYTERIKQADAVFFSGGDQLKLTSIYGGSDLLVQLKQRYINDHLVIGGTSAGAMAMSTPMIYAGSQEVQQISGEVKITTGLEFLKDVCIDTHFVDRSRFVRMSQVIATNPTCIGIGIEEDTALVIRNGIEAEVCGSGIVIIIEGEYIEQSNVTDFSEKQPISIRNLRVHLLSRGNRYQIRQKNPPHI